MIKPFPSPCRLRLVRRLVKCGLAEVAFLFSIGDALSCGVIRNTSRCFATVGKLADLIRIVPNTKEMIASYEDMNLAFKRVVDVVTSMTW